MLNFCTLFDSNYLTRGLALHASLAQVCKSFHLYVIAFNDDCYNYLKNANLPNLTPVSLKQFEDPELLKVKPTRSAAEYCWTCTPSIILYCLKTFQLPSCTYLDADMFFYDDPKILLDEMGEKSILISEHRYTKDYDVSSTHGIYCVQFMCFKNDQSGTEALHWWRQRCLEWCYSYLEDGKFGDQKYLDDWLTRFKGVHVLQHPGGGIAPWNVQQYHFKKLENQVIIIDKKTGKENRLTFFHFHGLKFHSDGIVSYSGALYDMRQDVKTLVYKPYVHRLLEIEKRLLKEGVSFNSSGARQPSPSKWHVAVEYLKAFTVLILKGKASPLSLKNYNFNHHYHFYKIADFLD